jgi:predicted DNA-binding transcriptional regulator AlpA
MTKIIEQIQQRHKKSILNKRETAIELGVSQATIDRLRQSGQLKSKKIGGGIFFTINEIAAFLEA